MTLLRRLAVTALLLGFGHVVFGAVVRITGSGLGCGDHWPRCHGAWFPPLDRMDLVIEVTHRYFAATLSLAILALLAAALVRRHTPGVSGRGGVLRSSALASALVIAAALFGAATVKLELTNKMVIVVHLAIAMALLAVLVVAAMRAGGLGAASIEVGDASSKSWRGARIAVVLAFLALVLGALTAHIPGANAACQGFPLCSGSLMPSGGTQHIQYTHRILAFVLLGHTLGLAIGVHRRGDAMLVRRMAWLSFAAVLLQIVVAAALVEMHLPAMLRSLHQAVGTGLWLVIFTFAALARRGALGATVAGSRSDARPLVVAGAEA